MGIYVNPGNITFQKILNSDIYIDKTDLVSVTNTKINKLNCYMCVSRPRRFGKSMAADMLVAYYSKGCDSAELFSGKKAESSGTFLLHLNRHNVIRLDIQRFLETEQDLDMFISEIERNVISELSREFPECTGILPDGRLKTTLEQIFLQTGEGFVFIIDEWDCVFRMARNRKEKQKEYLDFLRGLFKGSEYVELAYMTGILPIKKYGEHSAINIFDEYSMLSPKNLGRFFGFTADEVQEQCKEYGVEYADIKKWYDGYRIGEMHMYNPKSVIDALTWKEIQSYWIGTETYEALKVYIDLNFDGLKETVTMMLGNMHCKVNTRKFQNDMTTFKTKDDVLTLLVHLGYLTYDKKRHEIFIPNQEIVEEFMNVVEEPGWSGLAEALNQSEELLQYTWRLEAKEVAKGITAIHNETASILKYNNEQALVCTVLMAYYSAKAFYINPIMELPSGKGFADVVYRPKRGVNRPALVVELKWNQTAAGAIQQIKEKG